MSGVADERSVLVDKIDDVEMKRWESEDVGHRPKLAQFLVVDFLDGR